jgi:CRP-like cAMP-binding protein
VLTIEKVLILRSVSIFSRVPDDMLVELATVAEETTRAAGKEVFTQGDMGTSLYIVVQGRVRVHRDGRDLALLGEREVFGELAALDPEPRSATVTAVEETLLFQIDRDALYELLAEYVEVAQGIIQVLCQRLRAKPS